jgi:hypothetical protein
MRKRPALRADDDRRKRRRLDKIEKSENSGEGSPLANLFNDRRKHKSGQGKRLV